MIGPGGGGGGSRPFGEIFNKKINDNSASRSETTNGRENQIVQKINIWVQKKW